MRAYKRMLVVVALLLLPAPVPAQTIDPSGYWHGFVNIPDMTMEIEVDLAKDSGGKFIATFGQPAQRIKGLPFRSVNVEGRVVRLALKAGPEGSTFEGTVSEDSSSITGTVTQGGYSIPFTLTRKGEARMTPAPKSAAIAKELEGQWTGTLEVQGMQQRVIVTMTNHADGTATGTVFSAEGSAVEIPIAFTHKAPDLRIEAASIGGEFVGVVNSTHTEIAGTWKQGAVEVALTLRR